MQCLFAISEFRNYYSSGLFKLVRTKNPALPGQKYSVAIEKFSKEVDVRCKAKTRCVLKTDSIRSLIKE